MKNTFNELPSDALTRMSTLANGAKGPGVTGVSKSTIVRLVAAGLFPKPVKLSSRVTAWRVGDIRAWLQSQAQA